MHNFACRSCSQQCIWRCYSWWKKWMLEISWLCRELLEHTEYWWTLDWVMAWCRQATSHYLSQCQPSFLATFGHNRLNSPSLLRYEVSFWSILKKCTEEWGPLSVVSTHGIYYLNFHFWFFGAYCECHMNIWTGDYKSFYISMRVHQNSSPNNGHQEVCLILCNYCHNVKINIATGNAIHE